MVHPRRSAGWPSLPSVAWGEPIVLGNTSNAEGSVAFTSPVTGEFIALSAFASPPAPFPPDDFTYTNTATLNTGSGAEGAASVHIMTQFSATTITTSGYADIHALQSAPFVAGVIAGGFADARTSFLLTEPHTFCT